MIAIPAHGSSNGISNSNSSSSVLGTSASSGHMLQSTAMEILGLGASSSHSHIDGSPPTSAGTENAAVIAPSSRSHGSLASIDTDLITSSSSSLSAGAGPSPMLKLIPLRRTSTTSVHNGQDIDDDSEDDTVQSDEQSSIVTAAYSNGKAPSSLTRTNSTSTENDPDDLVSSSRFYRPNTVSGIGRSRSTRNNSIIADKKRASISVLQKTTSTATSSSAADDDLDSISESVGTNLLLSPHSNLLSRGGSSRRMSSLRSNSRGFSNNALAIESDHDDGTNSPGGIHGAMFSPNLSPNVTRATGASLSLSQPSSGSSTPQTASYKARASTLQSPNKQITPSNYATPKSSSGTSGRGK